MFEIRLAHRIIMTTFLSFVLLSLLLVALLQRLPPPQNPLWQLTSGRIHYDPRFQSPPTHVMLERPETSLNYYLEATLTRCQGIYPPLSSQPVTQYQVELVEYLGKTDYHAQSLVHTRLFFADGTSARAVFRFEAGHNEFDRWYVGQGSAVRTGAWFAVGALLTDPLKPPPGWLTYDLDTNPNACQHLQQPYRVVRSK